MKQGVLQRLDARRKLAPDLSCNRAKLAVDSAAVSPYDFCAITSASSKPPFLCLLSVIAAKLPVANN